MATVWSPAPYITKQEWLLSDGTIVTSPDFEATSSGRRIRVAGTADSFGSKQVDALMEQAISNIATQRGSTKIARLYPDAEADANAVGRCGVEKSVLTDAVTLHLLKSNFNQNRGGSTTAFWKFKMGGLPLYAYVCITLQQRHTNYTIQPRVVFRNTLPGQGAVLDMFTWDESNGAQSVNMYRYSPEAQAITEWCTANLKFPDLDFKDRSYQGQMRTAIVQFAELCKQFDNMDEITVPDLREGHQQIKPMKFKRTASNYSASFHNELLGFVQTGPVIDRIKDTYKSLMDDFRMLGLITRDEADDNAFAAAVNGEKEAIKCQLQPQEDAEIQHDAVDPHHTVTFDLASGTMVVNCARTNSLNEVAEAWDIAKFKAEVTGELDVLLEYAQAYRDPKEQKRLAKIIKQRAVPDA